MELLFPATTSTIAQLVIKHAASLPTLVRASCTNLFRICHSERQVRLFVTGLCFVFVCFLKKAVCCSFADTFLQVARKPWTLFSSNSAASFTT
jgi:hypothetical protein